jgi:hypothetical protein
VPFAVDEHPVGALAGLLLAVLRAHRLEVRRYRDQVRHGDRSAMPGAVRASAGINTTENDVARLLTAVARVARGDPSPIPYRQDPRTGDFCPCGDVAGQLVHPRSHQAPCSPG